ncbi:alpha/beta hydrolase [Nocardioides sp. KR10-350]|uniref:alpha/beta fold hydrolase n=1 Tax=Nocardioides cheoyonin TaxID=3156615 RepID=UPI0032B54237
MTTEKKQLSLPDGRELEVWVSGPPDGIPLVWHHGTPGCAYQSASKIATAAERGLRLVSYSRAGARTSTRRPGRSVADVAEDVAVILDDLGAERCITGGQSGGGPHTLATGALLPDRVAAVIVVCGVRPYGPGFLDGMGEDNHVEFGLALEGEEALTPYLLEERKGISTADPETVVATMSSLLPPPDRAVLTGELGADLLANLAGGVEEIYGWLDDDLAFIKPWGFELEDIRVPVSFWQGSEDLMVPQSHMPWQAERVPGSVMHLQPGEGHISLQVNWFGAMLDEALTHLR